MKNKYATLAVMAIASTGFILPSLNAVVNVSGDDIADGKYKLTTKNVAFHTPGFYTKAAGEISGILYYAEPESSIKYWNSVSEGAVRWQNGVDTATSASIILGFDFSAANVQVTGFSFEAVFAKPGAGTVSLRNYYSIDNGQTWVHITDADFSGSTVSWPALNSGSAVIAESSPITTIYFKTELERSSSSVDLRWAYNNNSWKPEGSTLLDTGNGFAIQFNVAPIPESSAIALLSGIIAFAALAFAVRRNRH